jgi:peroxiredoxin
MTEAEMRQTKGRVPRWAQVLIWTALVALLILVGMGLRRTQQGTIQPGEPIPNFDVSLYGGYEYNGRSAITLAELRGKVVLVNFWATWCPPCRKEMPDLEALFERFASQGLVILGISDEEAAKVEPFIRERKVTFPVLLDPGRKVNDMFVVEGIPKTFVYDREGKLVAQSIDMRTRKQFLEMLAKARIGESQK